MFDKRIDQVGCVKELVKQFNEPTIAAIKQSMIDRGEDRAEGTYFDAVLSAGDQVATVDPAKVYRKFMAGKITEADFLSVISVNRAEAKKVFGDKEVDRMSDFAPRSPALTVPRKKGVVIALVDAVKGVSDVI